VRAESGAREGFLGDITSDTMFEAFYKTAMSRSSVYVAVVIAGALVGEKVVNNGFDAMWESRNKGKLFKDMTIPEPEE
jgi:ubiquinol-cytochrome c reductase subunit 9